MKQTILTITISLALTACVSFKDATPAPTLFLINALETEQDERTEIAYTLKVEKPRVSSGINTHRIALTKDDGRILDYFSGARWKGRLDTILHEFMIETLDAQFHVVAAADGLISSKADYSVVSTVRDFQAEYAQGNLDQAPNLNISIVVAILRLKDNTLVSRFEINKTAQADSNTLTAITRGFQELLQQAYSESKSEFEKIASNR